jgi:site-specific DNA-methyltransferase (adenine-specific)
MEKLNTVILGECLTVMNSMPAHSVDMILADLPYNVSRNSWDNIIPLQEMWEAYKHVVKPDGAIVLTATQPFTSMLIMSNLKMFKYEWIWNKTVGSGQLNIKHQPLRTHESVLIFYNKKPTYNPQMVKGEPYSIDRKITFEGAGYGKQKPSQTTNTGFRYPKTVLTVSNPRIKNGHPTQKPVELMEYFIKTYTNEGDIVLDNVIGSGTTAIAALNTGRKFIGIENDETYYNMAVGRITNWFNENK